MAFGISGFGKSDSERFVDMQNMLTIKLMVVNLILGLLFANSTEMGKLVIVAITDFLEKFTDCGRNLFRVCDVGC